MARRGGIACTERNARLVCAGLCASALSLGACSGGQNIGDGSSAVDADASDSAVTCAWTCPAGWVPARIGGCGPAVVLCRDGLAMPGACDAIDAPPDAGADADSVHFHLAADHTIAGLWPRAGDVPDPDWSPDAGIGNCPTANGWTHASDGTCDPQLATNCDPTAGPLPGGSCTTTGASDCPVDPAGFADPGPDALGAVVVYVRAGSDPAVADGSMQRPFATIAAGVVAAGPDGWVLIGPGDYQESLEVESPVHLVGACAARTRIDGGSNSAAISAVGSLASIDLVGVSITGMGAGVMVSAGAHATVRNAIVVGAMGAGLLAQDSGTTLDAMDVRVSGTSLGTTTLQAGVVATSGATVSLNRAVITGNTGRGVQSDGPGAFVSITDSVVENSVSNGDTVHGAGLYVVRGGGVEASRVVIAANEEIGALAGGQGSTLTLSDAVVRDNGPTGTEQNGHGLYAIDSGQLNATDVLLDNNLRTGALADHATLVLTASVVRHARAPTSGGFGDALKAASGATLRASGVAMLENQGGGAIAGAGGTVALQDCSISDTGPGIERDEGAGLWAAGTLSARRVRVDRSWGSGVYVTSGGVVTLADSVVRDTRVDMSDYGADVTAQGIGSTTITASTIVSSAHVALQAASGASVSLSDSSLIGHSPVAHGLNCLDATVSARRVLVEHTAGSAFAVFPGGSLTIEDSRVNDVAQLEPLSGYGLSAAGGRLEASNVLVEQTTTAATVAYNRGVLFLRDAVVENVRNGAAGVAAGVVTSGEAHVDLQRVALLRTGGTALGTTPYTGSPTLVPGAQLIAWDLYVHDVRPSTVEATPAPESAPTGPLVSYGILAGTGSFLFATRATIDGANYGFLDSLGELTLDDVVVANHAHLGVVRSGGTAVAPALERVCVRAPGSDDVASDDSLPEVHFTSAP